MTKAKIETSSTKVVEKRIEKAETKVKEWQSVYKCVECRGITSRFCSGCQTIINIYEPCIIYSAQLGETADITVLLFCKQWCLEKSGLELKKNTDMKKGKLTVAQGPLKMTKKFCSKPLHRICEEDYCDDCTKVVDSNIVCNFCGYFGAFYKGYNPSLTGLLRRLLPAAGML